MYTYQAIVLAAGQGKRMKAGENKQFLNIEGKPLILHTLEVFNQDDWCTDITLVINPLERERMETLINNISFHKPYHLVDGGTERQESVFNGLKSLSFSEGELVFIHDGARPFVQRDDLHRLAGTASEHDAALLAVPVTDTIKRREENGRLTTFDRSLLWAAQTPQAFRYELIYQAHQQAVLDGYIGTDDASLLERMETHVEIVNGSYHNIKVTTPEDLEKASIILESFGKG